MFYRHFICLYLPCIYTYEISYFEGHEFISVNWQKFNAKAIILLLDPQIRILKLKYMKTIISVKNISSM